MKFILDENVSFLIEDTLRSLGHTFFRLPTGTKDNEYIADAEKERAAIITHDKDFLSLPFSKTGGVILLRIHPPWASDINTALKKFLTKVPSSEFRNKLVLLEREGFHIRF